MLKIKTISIFAIMALLVSSFGFLPASAFAATGSCNVSVSVTGTSKASVDVTNCYGNYEFQYWTASKSKSIHYLNATGTSSFGLIMLLEGTTYSYKLGSTTGTFKTLGGGSTSTGNNSSSGSTGTSSGSTGNTGSNNTSNTSTNTSTGSGGQVLGSSTGSSTGRTATNTRSGTLSGSRNSGTVAGATSGSTSTYGDNMNPRPSFISLEYSLADNGALVLVADDMKPRPGEEFSYTIVYKNDSAYPYNEAELKVIIPTEVDYISANAEPNRISGNIVEFKLGNIPPKEQGAIVIVVKVKETVSAGTNLIFTSVLGYKDRSGIQLATTSYMTVKVGSGSSASSAGFLLGLFSGSATLWLIALGLMVMMALLSYRLILWRRNSKAEEENNFGLPGVPATFEPVGSVAPSYKR